jgi:hypothetical protein
MFDGGFSSTAIGPIEAFHAAGRLWHRFHGEPEHPRFTVRTASIDGRMVTSAYSVGLTPQYAIDDIKQTDLILLTAPGADEVEGIVRRTSLVPWLRTAHERGTYIGGVCSGVAFVAETGLLDGGEPQPTGRSRSCSDSAIERNWRPNTLWRMGSVLRDGVYASTQHVPRGKFCGHDGALQCAKSLLVSLPGIANPTTA